MSTTVEVTTSTKKRLEAIINNVPFKHNGIYFRYSGDDKVPRVEVMYLRPGEQHGTLATFTLTGMPGCSSILVSTGVFVHEAHRRQGIASAMQLVKFRIARELKCHMIQCTVRADNDAQIAVLRKHEWFLYTHFLKERTGNNIALFAKYVTGGDCA